MRSLSIVNLYFGSWESQLCLTLPKERLEAYPIRVRQSGKANSQETDVINNL